MKIAIYHRENSFSERWITFCSKNQINFIEVDPFKSDVIDFLRKEKVTHFMWHVNHSSQKDLLCFPYLMNSLDQMGVKTFPNFNTRWHFDDKVAQKYLLESINAPIIPSYAFYREKDALKNMSKSKFPIVAKLKRGAGASNVILIKDKEAADGYIKKMFSEGINPNVAALDNIDSKIRLAKKIKNPITLFKKVIKHIKRSHQESKVNVNEKGYFYYQKFLPNNNFDTRVIIVSDRAIAIRRINRKDDFRASGSGNIEYDINLIDTNTVKIAFDVSDKLNTQSLAFDFVYNENKEAQIIEVCFGFSMEAYDDCPGYWDKNLNFIEENFNPQHYMIENFIN